MEGPPFTSEDRYQRSSEEMLLVRKLRMPFVDALPSLRDQPVCEAAPCCICLLPAGGVSHQCHVGTAESKQGHYSSQAFSGSVRMPCLMLALKEEVQDPIEISHKVELLGERRHPQQVRP